MDERHIPFAKEDEERIASVGVWGVIAAVTSIGSTVLSAVVALMGKGASALFTQVIAVTLNLILGIWLLQASSAFSKVATTDEADQHYLLLGFAKLRAYFMMTGIIIIIAVSLGVLLLLGALTCGTLLRSRY
jgi:hypothetical protein